MKEIERKKIEKAIKKTEKEAREWCDRDWRFGYRIMIDTDDAEIWLDVFTDCNSWNRYHSDTIFSLDIRVRGGLVGDAINKLSIAGWKII